MHSIVIKENRIVQNPSHSHNIADVVPTIYNNKHVVEKITFVVIDRAHKRLRKEAEPMFCSSLEPMEGKLIKVSTSVKILFPTSGESINRYISKLIIV